MTKLYNFAIGTSDFEDIIQKGSTYVDKTLLIKELMEDHAKVILFTRPRRFGKTLNMSMLECFLKIGAQKDLFDGLLIREHGEFCAKHQNQYPVIFLTFKDMKPASFEAAMTDMKSVLQGLYAQHRFLLEGDTLQREEKSYCQSMIDKEIGNSEEIGLALSYLMKYLHRYHGIRPIVILDEYDTPIQEGYLKGYYDKIIPFMRSLLGSALKDNRDLEKAILTGITRVSQESLFSGLNNVRVYSMLDPDYGEYFGFTQEEVMGLLPDGADISPIREWYNGYKIGNHRVYNPWSITSYLQTHQKLDVYWLSTSDNALVETLIEEQMELREDFEELLQGGSTEQILERSLTFPRIKTSPDALWTLLIHTGYLHVLESSVDRTGKLKAMVAIPNAEIRTLFIGMVENWFVPQGKSLNYYRSFIKKFLDGDIEDFSEHIQNYITAFSYFDFDKRRPEKIYHSFMTGLFIGLEETHEVTSNREGGKGRYDIRIAPIDGKGRGFLLEFKTAPQESLLDEYAEKALAQIAEKDYARGMKASEIISISMAFCGKALRTVHHIL